LNYLLLFLRYPQPGSTKIRLIPALGKIGAAQLQRQMVEYLLERLHQPAWQLKIYFTGSSLKAMQAWLGPNLSYCRQAQGDLGARLHAGFQSSFSKPWVEDLPAENRVAANRVVANRVVAIGADCPELGPQHIQAAFQQLALRDIVLGPAQDGGYYLIGLRQPQALLFQGIDWSTPLVFRQTQAKAQQLGLTLAQLPVLSDIDRPEDLKHWEKIQWQRQQSQTKQRPRNQTVTLFRV
jgi:uncharacterized protein